MEALIALLLNIGIPVLVIVVALIAGRIIEAKHYASIREREDKFKNLPAITMKAYDSDREVVETRLVTGAVVVSIDYFKRFLASLRKLIGGRIQSYESLLDRGRREAILRMKAQCPRADIIVHLRVETSSISKESTRGRQKVGCVEVLAYGTAIRYATLRSPDGPPVTNGTR